MYGTHILLLINTQVSFLLAVLRLENRRELDGEGEEDFGVHSSDACNNIFQSSSRE